MRRYSAISVLATLASAAPAQQTAQQLPAPREALVFKSGQAHLYRDVAVQAGSESTRLSLPDALHGSVWLGSDDVAIERATAHRVAVPEDQPVRSLGDAVRMAVGQDVQLRVQIGSDTEVVAGRVARILEGATPGAALVVVRANDRDAVYPLAAVRAVGHPARPDDDAWTYAGERQAAVLDVKHAPLPEGQAAGRIGLAALTAGIAWAPSYVLELGGEGNDRARLVGKAVLINDAEPLRDTRVRLVVGYPNLQFAGVPSGLLPDVTLDAFRQSILGATSGALPAIMSNPMSQVFSNIQDPRALPFSPAGPAGPTPGESAEDLYLYDIGSVTLAKGERAYVPLLDEPVRFAHRYDWDLPDRVDRNARFVQRADDEPQPVWHMLRLTNGGQAPWTTAPVLIQGERGPVAQSMLRYTPGGTTTQVQLTKALDLVGRTFEYRADDAQADRQERRVFGNRYEEIVVQGELELTNKKGVTAPVRIAKQLSGDVEQADGEPAIRGRAKGLGQVNASRTLTWEFALAPGQTWRAAYRYRVLIHR